MKKHTIKRPIIKKFIIGSLSAGLLVGGGAMELNAALSMEVYAADTTQETEGEEAAPTEAETPVWHGFCCSSSPSFSFPE